MPFPKLTKTKYRGLHTYKDSMKGTVYVGTFRIKGKLHKKIIGYSNDEFKTTEKIAFIRKEALLNEYKNDNIKKDENQKLITFNELYKEYIKSVKNILAESTISTKVYYYDKHIKPKVGDKLVTNLETSDFQDIVNTVLESISPQTKKLYAPQTAEHINKVSSSILTYATDIKKIIDNNVATKVKIPSFDNTVLYDLTEIEERNLVNTILTYDEEPDYRDIFTFLLHGHRKGEVLSLRADDPNSNKKLIDLENRTYTTTYNLNKNKKVKVHPITDPLYKVFVNRNIKKGYVFINSNTGTKYADVRKAWNRIKKKAGITKPFRIHDLRHLIGYLTLNELNLSSNVGSKILGNSPKVFEQRYSNIRVKTVNNALNKVFEHFSKGSKSKNSNNYDDRIEYLKNLGFTFSFKYNSYVIDDINISIIEIKTMNSDEWDNILKEIDEYFFNKS